MRDIRIVGERVKELRTQKGWTQGKLAQEAELGQSHISMIENQQRTLIRLDVADKLARALGVTVDDLMQRTPIKPQDL